MRRLVLVYNHPELGEQRVELEEGRVYRLGSKSENDIVFPHTDVSRWHAKLVVGTSTLQIVDLDSKNGTWLDGHRVTTATFRCGEPVMLSSATFVVLEADSDAVETPGGGDQRAGTPSAESGEQPRRRRKSSGEETVHRRLKARAAEFVELIERIEEGCRTANVTPVLSWAVERLGIPGVMVAYREGEATSVLASAGATGELLGAEGGLERLLGTIGSGDAAERGTQVGVGGGGSARVVTIDSNHLVVLRTEGGAPADVEIRALKAALAVVLTRVRLQAKMSGQEPRPRPVLEPGTTLMDAVEAFERAVITRVLEEEGGSRSRTAQRLGLSRAGLFKKMRRLGM